MNTTVSIQGRLGVYRVGAFISEGTFGAVFRAVDHLGRHVAIKYIRNIGDIDSVQRFKRELRILLKLDHPNIVKVFDHGADSNGRLWYAMPLMEGGTLADVIERDRTIEEVLTVLAGVARGLAAYHARNGIHRDVKPENILMPKAGAPQLADFGVARCPDITGSEMTRSPNGTRAYMAPEMFEHAACQASDVYALGIILWELVNGARHRIPARPPERLGAAKGLEALEQLYAATTTDDPNKRPRASDVAEHCERILNALRKPVPGPRTIEPNPLPWIFGGIAFMGVIAVIAKSKG